MIGYLNIDSVRNKTVQLTGICKTPLTEFLDIDGAKLDSSSSNAQVHLPDYQFQPFRRDQDSSGGGKILYICTMIIVKGLTVNEIQITESIYVEINVKKRKWRIFFYPQTSK